MTEKPDIRKVDWDMLFLSLYEVIPFALLNATDHVEAKKALEAIRSLPQDDWTKVVSFILGGIDPIEEWQPMDTAPKDGTKILATDGKFVETVYWLKLAGYWWSGSDGGLFRADYWQPLPGLPSLEDEK